MNKPLGDMTVLITGASRGIGRAIAERFATVGMNVVINYMHAHEAANQTARLCLKHGAKPVTVAADVSSKEQVLRMKEKLDNMQLYPDIIVNNAGIGHYGMLADVTEDDWDRVIDVNLKGMFLCSQAFMGKMVSQKYGRIVNISSIWGESGSSCEVLYSTSKGGVNAFTKALAKELGPSGITVNAVAPGAVQTEMLDHLDDGEKSSLREDIPAGRFANPEEIASLVYFLALPESAYINGQIISPNGGWVT